MTFMWTNTYDFNILIYIWVPSFFPPSIKCLSYLWPYAFYCFYFVQLIHKIFVWVKLTANFNVLSWWANGSYYSLSDKLLGVYSVIEKQTKL